MSAATIIKEVVSDGLHLALTERGTIDLSGDKSVIAKWAPIIKLHKPEIIAALAANDVPLAPDLEHLIVRAGAFWEYSPEDYDLIREVARRDPEGLRLALETDVAFSRPD